MKIKRPENYLDEIKYLENERTIKQDLQEMFAEVDSSKKEFLKYGIFEFRCFLICKIIVISIYAIKD